jgi:co-chaperonin GroES (HSP10)
VEFFVVVELDPAETKTAGGIILLDNTKDRDKLATQEGTLVAVSPHAFTYAEGWPEGSIPQVGQRVLFKKFAGALHSRKVDGQDRDFRLLNDKDVIAIVEPEASQLSAAA